MVLDLVKLQHLSNLSVDKLSTIVTFNSMRHPDQKIMFSLMKFAITPPMALQSGMASAHLVKYSLATRIHMHPREGGLSGPTKLSP